jgi:hypothetical protein
VEAGNFRNCDISEAYLERMAGGLFFFGALPRRLMSYFKIVQTHMGLGELAPWHA